jgi:hypothetical protein
MLAIPRVHILSQPLLLLASALTSYGLSGTTSFYGPSGQLLDVTDWNLALTPSKDQFGRSFFLATGPVMFLIQIGGPPDAASSTASKFRLYTEAFRFRCR